MICFLPWLSRYCREQLAVPAREATIPTPDQESRGPCSHPGVSTAEAKVPPEALNLHHGTRGGHRAASRASQMGLVLLGWLWSTGSAALETEGPQGVSALTDSHPMSVPHRDGLSDSSASRARGDAVHAGGHDVLLVVPSHGQRFVTFLRTRQLSCFLALPRYSEDASACPGCDIAIC